MGFPKVQKPAPAWTAVAVINKEFKKLALAEYRGKWVVLFFYPKDFTFVCPTEICQFSDRADEFKALNCEVVGCSTDTENCHLAWINTPRKEGGLGDMQIPLIADVTKKITADYGVLVEEGEDAGLAARGTFLISPDGIMESITINNLGVGRNVDETLRLLKAFQHNAQHGEVCPMGWKPGDKTMVADPVKSKEYFASGATEKKSEEAEEAAPAAEEEKMES